jgi:SAM-dependent methyltransferase
LKGEWFKDWFETIEYLTVYKHRDSLDATNAVDLILKNIDKTKTKSVLDLACGAGRHSILLAQKGFDVVGVDLSKNLLKNAKSKANELQLSIKFIEADLRTFSVNRTFDLILNLFTSFGYFNMDEENEKIFSLASRLLNDDGIFIFDYFNSEYVIKNLVPYSIDKYDDFTIEQFRSIQGDRVVKIIKITTVEGVREFTESVRLYSLEWIKESLQINDFQIENVYGTYDGDEFSIENSPRIFITCKK